MFEQVLFKNRYRFIKSGRARQNLPGLILIMLLGLSLFCARAEALSKKKPPEKYKFDRQVRIWLGTQDSILIQSSGEIVIECYRNGERAEIYYTSADIRLLARKGKLAVEDDNSKLAIGLGHLYLGSYLRPLEGANS